MRNGFLGLVSALVLGSMAAIACSNGNGSGGTAGSTGSGGGGGSSSGGTGGGGGGASPITTLSGTRAVNSLSAAEAEQLCSDSYAYFGTSIPKATTCKWKGLAFGASSSAPTDAQLQSNCTSKESSCQQLADPWADNPGCNEIPATCTATVEQYSTCIRDEVTAFLQLVNGFPVCAMLARSNASDILTAIAGDPSASCASLMNTCPDLYPPGPLNQ
jgi:hypothetical protein